MSELESLNNEQAFPEYGRAEVDTGEPRDTPSPVTELQPEAEYSPAEALGQKAVDTTAFAPSDQRTGYNLPEPDNGGDDTEPWPPSEPAAPLPPRDPEPPETDSTAASETANRNQPTETDSPITTPSPTAPLPRPVTTAPSEPATPMTEPRPAVLQPPTPPAAGPAESPRTTEPTPDRPGSIRPEKWSPPERLTVHLPSERTVHTDRLIRETSELIKDLDPETFDPEVRPAVRMLEGAVGNLVVPTVVNGVATLPPSAQGSNGLVVVRLMPGETSVKLDSSLLATPTPSRLRATSERYGVPKEVIEAGFERAQQRLEARPDYPLTTRFNAETGAGTTDAFHFMRHPVTHTPMHLQARPTIVLGNGVRPTRVAHELIHGIDNSLTWRQGPVTPTQERAWRATKEMRASHVGARSTPLAGQTTLQHQQKVENIRLAYPARRPFDPTPPRIRALIEEDLLHEGQL